MKLMLASSNQVPLVFKLIQQRIDWMDKMHIQQWNVTNYLDVFPLSYFNKKQQEQKLYVLMEEDELCAACILEEDDEGWYDQSPSLYVHQLVADCRYPGSGSYLLEQVEKLAAAKMKKWVRLDCIKTNQALNYFYEKRGYQKVGSCQFGLYEGYLREKQI